MALELTDAEFQQCVTKITNFIINNLLIKSNYLICAFCPLGGDGLFPTSLRSLSINLHRYYAAGFFLSQGYKAPTISFVML